MPGLWNEGRLVLLHTTAFGERLCAPKLNAGLPHDVHVCQLPTQVEGPFFVVPTKGFARNATALGEYHTFGGNVRSTTAVAAASIKLGARHEASWRTPRLSAPWA